MSQRFIGQRGSHGDQWTWETPSRVPERRVGGWRWRVVLATFGLLGAGLIVAGAVLLAAGTGNETASPQVTASPSPRPSAIPARSPVPAITAATPTPLSSPTPVASPMAQVRLAAWSKTDGAWVYADLSAARSGYREGETVPFLLEIDGATASQIFETSIHYLCKAGGIAAFDFVTSYDATAGKGPSSATGGPGRALPDSTVPVPDYASISVDNANRGTLQLWGATPDGAPTGPLPATSCADEKSIDMRVVARQSRIYLAWGGHLAPGAAGQHAPIGVTVEVQKLGRETLNLLIGAITR